MKYSRILATGSYLPEKILTNDELSKTVDTSNEWIVERVGIKQRHIAAPDETSSSMAEQAARRALETAGLKPDDLGMIIVATCTPDMTFPSTACFLQRRLEIKTACPAFDIGAVCAGFNYALSVADQYVRSGAANNVLVVGSETMSRIVNWQDRTTCVIFGDGAGAVILEQSDEPGIISTHLHADGQYTDLLYTPNEFGVCHQTEIAAEAGKPEIHNPENYKLVMKGREVFKVAVNSLRKAVVETLEANNLPHDSVDWLIPHQANYRIIKAVADKLGLSMERVIITLGEQGNTSAASVPLALDYGIRDGRVKRGQTLLLESFGGGLAWGSALIKY